MRNNLGEVFYDGRIINLNRTEEQELREVLAKVKEDKHQIKEQIEKLLEKITENRVNEV